MQWTRIALRLIREASDAVAVVREYTAKFSPTCWSGSLAPILEAKSRLLDQIEIGGNMALETFIAAEKSRLQSRADQERMLEATYAKGHEERFE